MNMQELTQAVNDAGTAVGVVGDSLTASSDELGKALGEISTEITSLQGTIAAGAQTTPEVDAALASFQTKISNMQAVAQSIGTTAKSLDDIVPDPAGPAPTP